MENNEILKDQQIEETETEIVETDNEVVIKEEYLKTVSVKAYGKTLEMALDQSGITAGDEIIKKEDIVLVNRYINMPGIKRTNWFLNRDAQLFYQQFCLCAFSGAGCTQ